MAREKSWNWIQHLNATLTAYNKTRNRILEMTPTEAEKKENQSRVFYNSVIKVQERKIKKAPTFKYKVGQVVRILKDQTFAKSYMGSYSNLLYEIYDRKIKTKIPFYFLRELLTEEKVTGGFYEQELKPVNIDKSKLPKIEQIYGIRLDREQEEVQVKINGKKQWLNNDDLIPYV